MIFNTLLLQVVGITMSESSQPLQPLHTVFQQLSRQAEEGSFSTSTYSLPSMYNIISIHNSPHLPSNMDVLATASLRDIYIQQQQQQQQQQPQHHLELHQQHEQEHQHQHHHQQSHLQPHQEQPVNMYNHIHSESSRSTPTVVEHITVHETPTVHVSASSFPQRSAAIETEPQLCAATAVVHQTVQSNQF